MPSSVILRYACDRCPVVVESEITVAPAGLPVGWRRNRRKVFCPDCVAALETFAQANAKEEQSR